MYTYELVCVIDAVLASKEVDALKKKIEKALPEIKATDEMGLLPLAYPLRGQDQAYFVSYHIGATAEQVIDLKSMLRLEKSVAKYVFYAMREQDQFLHFTDLQKSYDALIAANEAEKMEDAPVQEEAEKMEVIAGDVVVDAEEASEETEEA